MEYIKTSIGLIIIEEDGLYIPSIKQRDYSLLIISSLWITFSTGGLIKYIQGFDLLFFIFYLISLLAWIYYSVRFFTTPSTNAITFSSIAQIQLANNTIVKIISKNSPSIKFTIDEAELPKINKLIEFLRAK